MSPNVTQMPIWDGTQLSPTSPIGPTQDSTEAPPNAPCCHPAPLRPAPNTPPRPPSPRPAHSASLCPSPPHSPPIALLPAACRPWMAAARCLRSQCALCRTKLSLHMNFLAQTSHW